MELRGSILGSSVQRREDPSLLVGADLFVGDLGFAPVEGHAADVNHLGHEISHVHIVRSDIAHAKILDIDTSEAASMPGVLGVFVASDLDLQPNPSPGPIDDLFSRPLLARQTVRFVGEPYAIVVAKSQAEALDAAELIFADLDPLPVVTDQIEAVEPGAPILFEGANSNQVFQTSVAAPGGHSDADPTEGADVVVTTTMRSQRVAGVPLETNGCVAVPNGDELTLWVSSQSPLAIAHPIAKSIGMDPTKLRIVAPAVGGGFGPKIGGYPEYQLVAALARKLNVSLRWIESRSENMVNMVHGRDHHLRARLGLTAEGAIVGLDVEVTANAGAYPQAGAVLVSMTQLMAQGVYDVKRLRFNARSVVTNTTPTGAYRGAGRPEATQLIERVLDMAADELGIDPAEIRRRNFLPADSFPLTTLTGANYDSGNYLAALDRVLEIADYDGLRAEQERRRATNAARQLGIGVSSYVEVTAPDGLFVEFGAVEIHHDGSVTVRVGTSPHGQGHETTLSMIVAEQLGVPLDAVTVLHSDSAQVDRGLGTMGSRTMQTAGSAVYQSAGEILAKAKTLAAFLWETDEGRIVVGENGLEIDGRSEWSIDWAELAAAADDPERRPDGMEPGLSAEVDFDGTDSTYPFGSHVSVVEVDTETGEVTMLNHFAVDDCGRILNPLLVTGQQHGGIAQGAAQALFEEVVYDEFGTPVTSNLMDYAIPSAAELCFFEAHNTETPSPRNPLGVKGIGESGTIGSTPAIQNAVVDAVSHLGVRHIDMPLSSYRVWRALQAAGSAGDTNARS